MQAARTRSWVYFRILRESACAPVIDVSIECGRPDYLNVLDGLQASNLLLKVADGLSTTRTRLQHLI